ncbi:AI-2E family transporter [Nocardioides cavernaquae]|uniref:AI-2E family transporter n=1 Tax=Nocardioides cavernaquae TaxID=2321396 RepID=A0A3A5H3C2_9ACTN|nr:AI-2E family transporter [Nocardioides cavernaquae]RJS45279.1 AI-2E family transporter [Nocardioides cavernaquae]
MLSLVGNDAEGRDPVKDESAPTSAAEEPEHGHDAEETDDRRTERLTHLLAQQWSQLRSERRPEVEPFRTGPSNFSRAQVPWGLDLAAAWSWRLIIIAAAALGTGWVLSYFAVITLPLVVALLITALAAPVVRGLADIGVPRALSAGLVVVLGLATVIGLLTFVGNQVAQGASDLADQVVVGLGEIRRWLKDGPIDASDSQINDWIKSAQESITERSKSIEVAQLTEFGTAIGHVFAGFFIVLFSTFFFLSDGHRIWGWIVRVFPRAARENVDSSGRVAWISLTQFVRATVIVALVDAIGIMLGALALGLPLVLPIGVLVFLGAFVPMVGAAVAGLVATLVALVTVGPLQALIMLGVVIAVQQLEGHVLQPLVMGRFVSVHPLGVIVAIGCGVLVAGIAGALIAVPLAAVGNAVVTHLSRLNDPQYDAAVDAIESDQPA